MRKTLHAMNRLSHEGAVDADWFLWASDFPHADHTPEYVTDLEALAASFPDEDDRQAFFGGNARTLFDIGA